MYDHPVWIRGWGCVFFISNGFLPVVSIGMCVQQATYSTFFFYRVPLMLCDNYNGFTTYQGMSSYTFTVLWWCISSILHQTYTTPMCLSVTWFNSRWYLCPALHPISQKFPHCWMVSVRCAPPHQSEVSPLLDGICALRSTPSLRSFPIVGWYPVSYTHLRAHETG